MAAKFKGRASQWQRIEYRARVRECRARINVEFSSLKENIIRLAGLRFGQESHHVLSGEPQLPGQMLK